MKKLGKEKKRNKKKGREEEKRRKKCDTKMTRWRKWEERKKGMRENEKTIMKVCCMVAVNTNQRIFGFFICLEN